MKQLPLKNHLRTIYNVGVSETMRISFLPMQEGHGKVRRTMRKYKNDGTLETVICNACGKKVAVKDGIVREGVLGMEYSWDYFSEKDGEIHRLELCEACYDRLVQTLRVPVEIEERTEWL